MQFAKQVKRRRGTAAENAVFTGAEGEIVVDLTNHKLRVHDGTTVGGFGAVTDSELASEKQTINNSLKTKATKATDFMTPLTNTNKGATNAEVENLKQLIDTAAASGNLIGSFWFGKSDPDFTAPAPTLVGQNYFDFTNNTPYTANSDLSGWTAGEPIPAPTVDSQIQITSKFWNIPEQDGQQGGIAYWSHLQSKWSYAPRIISFDNPQLTGTPTAPSLMDTSPDNQIVNKASAVTITRDNVNFQKVITAGLTAQNDIVLDSGKNNIFLLTQNAELTDVAINITSSNTSADECYTYEIRLETGDTIPTVTWSDNVEWLKDSETQPTIANKTAIFVVQTIGTRIICNYAGAY